MNNKEFTTKSIKKSKYTFTIESKSDTGFILKNEDMRLEFKKRQ